MSDGTEAFSRRDVGWTTEPCNEPQQLTFITFEVNDALGNPLTSTAALEHPDGTLERVQVNRGYFHRDGVVPGNYALHLPALGDARWSTDSIVLRDDATPSPPKMTASYCGFAPATRARLTVHDEGRIGGASALFETTVALEPTAAWIEDQTLEVAWDLSGLPGLQPGEGRELVFTVEIANLRTITALPLWIERPLPEEVPEPEPPPPEGEPFVRFELSDAFGTALTGAYALVGPDGTIVEEGELAEGGVIHHEGAAEGEYTVLRPELRGAEWTCDAIEWTPDPATADLVFESSGIAAGTKATIEIHHEGREAGGVQPVHVLEHALAIDDAKLWTHQQSRVTYDLAGLRTPQPGEACALTFRVVVGSAVAHARDSLLLEAPLPEEAPEQEAPPTADAIYVRFELADALGNPTSGTVLLEHPDGTFSDAELEDGALHRDGAPAGEYAVHIPELVAVRWSVAEAQWSDASAPAVDLVLEHRAVRPGTSVDVVVHYEGRERSGAPALHACKVAVGGDASRLGEVQRTQAPVDLGRLPPLHPGQERAIVLLATMGASTVVSREPLLLSCADPPEGDE